MVFQTKQLPRRQFLAVSGAAVAGLAVTGSARAGHVREMPETTTGVLVDLTECVGCRLCEYACKESNGFDPGTLKSYDDQSVFRVRRRPGNRSLTVLNEWKPKSSGKSVFTKVNCLHCNHPACVSACIVGALQKQDNGAVTYDAWKCIGCRYCMVACPFQIPTYEYDEVLTPKVKKCEFCPTRTSKGDQPACVQKCPRQALTYGKRSELVELAHEKIRNHPDRYINHIYGEHEVGGTSWLYLSNVPFDQAGFLSLGTEAPPALTEAIQHGVFKHWIAPIGWYGFLATMFWWTGRKVKLSHAHANDVARGSSQCVEPPDSYATTGWKHTPQNGAVAVLDHPPVVQHYQPSHDDTAHGHAEPVGGKLLTPGVWVLIGMVIVGVLFGLYRFIFGLAAATNLDQQHPWGLWIAMDVGSGIALAGGGFVTAAVVHIFHREHYHAVARSALLTALLGYTFYVPGLLADIGRWYNIWHPTIPMMWQGNSVLFEVGICVMIYLNVQYAEMAPIVIERLMQQPKYVPRKLVGYLKPMYNLLERIMPALLILGVALSTFHQSSLGNLMVIAPYKLHPLWWSPLSPLLFLLSAMMVGFPMVIFTMLFASWTLKRRPEMHVLSPLARYVPVFLSVYLATKIGDVVWRGVYPTFTSDPIESISWIVEMAVGVIAPLVMLMNHKVRNSPRWLGISSLLVILGVVLNRLNVFVIGYHPPFAEKTYFPSLTEFAVSAGLVAALMLTYRVTVTYLPILEPRQKIDS